ncbi:chloride channel [Hypoxylon texense]
MASDANLRQPSRELQSPKLPSHPSTIANEVNTGTQNPRPKRPYYPQCDHCQCYNCRQHGKLESLSQSRRSSRELQDDTNGDDDHYGDADDDDDPDKDDGSDKDDPDGDEKAEIVKSWRDSVKPGSPPGSSASSSQSWDITGRDRIVWLNELSVDERVTPLYVTALLEMSKQPFDPEKEGYKNHVYLQDKIDTFRDSSSSNLAINHATFLSKLREVLPFSGDSFINTLKALRMDREAPEIEFITDGAGEELMKHHLQSLLFTEYSKAPKPDVVVGMPLDRVKSIAIGTAGSRGTEIARQIRIECWLYDSGPFFPYLLVFCGSEMPRLQEELSIGFAAALASGSGWIGQDNPIFGLTVIKTSAILYIAWAVTCEEEGLTYTKYIYKGIDRWFIENHRDNVGELERLQGVIMRIHLWGTGDRRKKLESELAKRIRMQSQNRAEDRQVLPLSTTAIPGASA